MRTDPDASNDLYASYWQAGFEGADHVNGSAQPLSMSRLTGHLVRARGDYRRLAALGIRTARESAGWREAGPGPRFNFDSVGHRENCAHKEGVQILWTFFHYGVPPGVDFFDDDFVDRFAEYCAALARYLKPFHSGDRTPVYTPINEISFLTWAVCETGLLHPHLGDRAHDGYALKQRLVRATIAACDAIRGEDDRARFLIVDPLIHVAPRTVEDASRAQAESEFQFQAWDMLCGRLEPQLGGGPAYLDLVGVNYYPHNQWYADKRESLSWPDHPERAPFSALLCGVHKRYQRPLTIAETSHIGRNRGPWLIDVCMNVLRARDSGVRIDGVCLYPALDRPDWEDTTDWHDSGLWRVHPTHLARELDTSYAEVLATCQNLIGPARRHEQR
jgi:UDP-galactopyranose mutase